jgi:hypothetical protein
MSNSITTVTHAPPAQQPQAATQNVAVNSKPAASKPTPTPTDTVQISNAASAILQEAQENRAQTVQEANSGDSQARRLLAKEAAATVTPKG